MRSGYSSRKGLSKAEVRGRRKKTYADAGDMKIALFNMINISNRFDPCPKSFEIDNYIFRVGLLKIMFFFHRNKQLAKVFICLLFYQP